MSCVTNSNSPNFDEPKARLSSGSMTLKEGSSVAMADIIHEHLLCDIPMGRGQLGDKNCEIMGPCGDCGQVECKQ